MNKLQQVKTVLITPPAARVNNGSFTTAAIDTAGYGKAAIFFATGDLDIALTVLKLQEDDASGMGSASDITGCVFGASGAPALPTASDDNKIYGFFVNLAGRKRYLDLVVTVGNGTAGCFGTAWAVLYNGEIPNTAAERGLAAQLIKD